MLYKQNVSLPVIFQVDENILEKLESYLERNALKFHRILVLSGSTQSKGIAKRIMFQNSELRRLEVFSNTFEEVERIKEYCLNNRVDLLIAVGGGKVLDLAKRVSYLISIDNIAVPTIISNDGLISPISVLQDNESKSHSLPGMMPMGVIIDLEVIRNSPSRYIKAAAGDILSNISATNDWVIAYDNAKESINDLSYHLARGSASSLVSSNFQTIKDKSFLRLLVLAQINSGLSMALAGTSRPCSGSEHLLSHAIDYLGLTNEVLHGSQVASTSLFTLYLQNKLSNQYLYYAEEIGVELFFDRLLTDSTDENLLLVFNISRNMRPGRVTVLDMYSDAELLEKLKSYHSLIRSKSKNNNRFL